MAMRRPITRVALLAVAGLALIAASVSKAAAAEPAAHMKCPPSNRHPDRLVSDRQAVIYEGLILHGEGAGQEEVFGCTYGKRRSYAIGTRLALGSGGGGVDRFTLGGPVLAYESRFTDQSGDLWQLVVVDLNSGIVLHAVPTGVPVEPSEHYEGVGPAVAIVVKGDGSIAWIADDFERTAGTQKYYDVEATDHSGSRLLASGTNIKPSSLKLVGSTVSWRQAGKSASAVLK
jgi:hypothetical protein